MSESPLLSRHYAVALLAIVVLSWGLNWPVTKLIVEHVPALWTTAIRCWIACVALAAILIASGKLVLPPRGDMPVVWSIALLHMVLFSALVATGLKFVPAGKAIVLGYTTPLWVALAAPLLLGERSSTRQRLGVALGLLGIVTMLSPWTLDWGDADFLLGSGCILLAAACWAANILYARSHRWIASPFQLLLWQTLVAATVLTISALLVEGIPNVTWTPRLLGLFLYGGLIGTALAYWAMSVVNKSLPAVSTAIGVTATPVVGVACATLALGERLDASLLVAAVLIVSGIAITTLLEPGARGREGR